MSYQSSLKSLLITGEQKNEPGILASSIKKEYPEVHIVTNTKKEKSIHNKETKKRFDAALCLFTEYTPDLLKEYSAKIKPLCHPTTPLLALLSPTQSPSLHGFDAIIHPPINIRQIMSRIENIQRLKLLENELVTRLQTSHDFNVIPITPPKKNPSFKVLYVGNAHPSFMVIQKALKQDPIEIYAAFTTFSTFDWLYSHDIDLIILNAIEQPEIAISICKALRRNSAFYHLPIIILQNEKVNRPEDCFSMRVSDIIFPSFSCMEIQSRILSLLFERQRRLTARSTLELTKDPQLLDSETQLYNQTFLLKHIMRITENSDIYGYPLSLCTMVIRITSQSGTVLSQETKSRIYKQWGEMLLQLVRAEDLPARLDQDIFTYLLPSTDIKGAEIVQKRLKGVAACAAFDSQTAEDSINIRLLSNIIQRKQKEDGIRFLKRSVESIFLEKTGSKNQHVIPTKMASR